MYFARQGTGNISPTYSDFDEYQETGRLHVDNHWEWRNGYVRNETSEIAGSDLTADDRNVIIKYSHVSDLLTG